MIPPRPQSPPVPSRLAHSLELGPPDSVRGTVVCIEDHPINMAQVEAMLEEFPHLRLVKAATGREGLELVRQEKPDLVLLDMNLPDIGGLQVVRELNVEIAVHKLKVVLLTSDALSIDVVKAMSLGAHDYWLKPITRERLRAALAIALHAPGDK